MLGVSVCRPNDAIGFACTGRDRFGGKVRRFARASVAKLGRFQRRSREQPPAVESVGSDRVEKRRFVVVRARAAAESREGAMATASDAAEEYRATLGELTNNNKTQINLLTILAEDYAQFAGAIVQVIDAQILQVPPSLNVFADRFRALFVRTKSYFNLKFSLGTMGTLLSPPYVVVNTNLLNRRATDRAAVSRRSVVAHKVVVCIAIRSISDQRVHRQNQLSKYIHTKPPIQGALCRRLSRRPNRSAFARARHK